MEQTQIILGNCTEKLKEIGNNSIDLILLHRLTQTNEKNTYGGIHPGNYVNWFLPISKELYRVAKPSGTFVLNIKERVVAGERHTYVLDLN
jgi:DNA modification methylase